MPCVSVAADAGSTGLGAFARPGDHVLAALGRVQRPKWGTRFERWPHLILGEASRRQRRPALPLLLLGSGPRVEHALLHPEQQLHERAVAAQVVLPEGLLEARLQGRPGLEGCLEACLQSPLFLEESACCTYDEGVFDAGHVERSQGASELGRASRRVGVMYLVVAASGFSSALSCSHGSPGGMPAPSITSAEKCSWHARLDREGTHVVVS